MDFSMWDHAQICFMSNRNVSYSFEVGQLKMDFLHKFMLGDPHHEQ
jgi:hypothetical protein